MSIADRIKSGWNAFLGRDPTYQNGGESVGYSTTTPSGKIYVVRGAQRSFVNAVYNRIALDVAAVSFDHVVVDQNENYKGAVSSELHSVLGISANIDQTWAQLMQDAVLSMFDEGYVALVPVDTNVNPRTGEFDVLSMRVGQILEWYPKHVRVRVYNESIGQKREVVLRKSFVPIIVNPLYEVMNRPNSTLQRLLRKLSMLDAVDERNSAGKLNMLVQVPYTIKTSEKQEFAKKRIDDIQQQLTTSPLGIAYVDSTEHIIQLNRGVDNNLQSQVDYLTSMLYSQLGLAQSVFDGTADENAMMNYRTRTIVPILSAFADEMTRKLLSKKARDKKMQRIKYIQEPFKLVPTTQLADLADRLTRNEILTSNEVRALIGYKPVDTPEANELRNKNINRNSESSIMPVPLTEEE